MLPHPERGGVVERHINSKFKIYLPQAPLKIHSTTAFSSLTSKFGEFISPAKVALVCLKFILIFIEFCSLVTKLWLICGF